MANYRLSFSGGDDHIVQAEIADCPTDSDAEAVARICCGDHRAVDVWEPARHVEGVNAVIDADHSVIMNRSDLLRSGGQQANSDNIILETIFLRNDVRTTCIALRATKTKFKTEMRTLSAKTRSCIQHSYELLDRLNFTGKF